MLCVCVNRVLKSFAGIKFIFFQRWLILFARLREVGVDFYLSINNQLYRWFYNLIVTLNNSLAVAIIFKNVAALLQSILRFVGSIILKIFKTIILHNIRI